MVDPIKEKMKMGKVTIIGKIDPQKVFDALAAQIGCTAVLVPKERSDKQNEEKDIVKKEPADMIKNG